MCPTTHQDLKWCKRANTSYFPFKTFHLGYGLEFQYTYCASKTNSVRVDLQVQQIKTTLQNNSRFDCHNRQDETPFLKKNHQTKKLDKTEMWLRNVNMSCPKGRYYRRCLGHQPEECIYVKCKYSPNCTL